LFACIELPEELFRNFINYADVAAGSFRMSKTDQRIATRQIQQLCSVLLNYFADESVSTRLAPSRLCHINFSKTLKSYAKSFEEMDYLSLCRTQVSLSKSYLTVRPVHGEPARLRSMHTIHGSTSQSPLPLPVAFVGGSGFEISLALAIAKSHCLPSRTAYPFETIEATDYSRLHVVLAISR
jgi:hypothetical protein